MNREVHVRFWESAGLRCPAPLTFIKAYGSVIEARRGIGGWLSLLQRGAAASGAGLPDAACGFRRRSL